MQDHGVGVAILLDSVNSFKHLKALLVSDSQCCSRSCGCEGLRVQYQYECYLLKSEEVQEAIQGGNLVAFRGAVNEKPEIALKCLKGLVDLGRIELPTPWLQIRFRALLKSSGFC